MKVLVYGAGVIGGQLTHALMKSGNDVSVVVRGAWKDSLENNGLCIHHYIQRKDTVDHPRILEKPGEEHYDIVFAVMQYRQMEKILDDLAAVNSGIAVLVGNNLAASEMEEYILRKSPYLKEVLFGFGSTAGTREKGKLTTVHTGDGSLTVGKLDEEPREEEKILLQELFKRSKVSLSWCDNMDAWLKYHAAFILPVVYLCYKTDCDLRKSTREDRKLLLDAVKDAYHLLTELGYPVRPAGDEKTLEPGPAYIAMKLVIFWMSRTRTGALCTTEHCRHAPQEMEELDRAFQVLRKKAPGFPMPDFDRLYRTMPSWDQIRIAFSQNSK